MALRVFTRRSGENFVASPVLPNLAAVRDALQVALLDVGVTDCLAEDDSQAVMASRWFVLFQNRRGLTG